MIYGEAGWRVKSVARRAAEWRSPLALLRPKGKRGINVD